MIKLRHCGFVLASGITLLAQENAPEPLEQQLKKFIDVFSLFENEAADRVSPDIAFYQGALPSMMRTLDPHSAFFDPGQFQQLQQMERSEQKGFGAIVSVIPGRVIVLQVLDGTPSAKAGLSAGDELLGINGYELARLDIDDLIQLLGVAHQKDAVVDVKRPGSDKLLQFTLSPALVNTPSLDRSFMAAPGLGYVRITSFEGPTGQLVADTIDKLGGNDLKGLVLDLRGNPGGDVNAAIQVASLFLKPDQLIFTIKGRSIKTEEVRIPKLARPYTFPVAVLMNATSASASEIVAGSLQDHDRATILGEATYGKGLVQQVFPLSANTGLALTTAFYYTPSGRSIQKQLHGGQLDAATLVDQGPYKTDSGREVRGGGGIQPDERRPAIRQTRLQLFLEGSGALTSFATEYIRAHDIPAGFEVTPAVLDELKIDLSGRSIQPSIGEWLTDRDWIASRLKQEIYNLKFGVAKGDEIELTRDPVVRQALEKLRASAK